MSWVFENWQDFFKKKACRYILQHYLGQFLKEKLSVDQLSVDLYNGTGKITELNLDVQAINDDLTNLNVPVKLVDGFVECISVNIPWSTLVQDSTRLEVNGLELTMVPKQIEDNGMMAGEMFSSMQSSMTTSLQLAKECLRSESDIQQKAQPIEGVQKFANMIDSVLSKIKVSLTNTVIRLEHHPESSTKGVALELRIDRIEYFDDMAISKAGTSVDRNSTCNPTVYSVKNLQINGVRVFFDELSRKKTQPISSSHTDCPSVQTFMSARSAYESLNSQSLTDSCQYTTESFPIQVALLTERQEIKLKTKQTDTTQGTQLEISCFLGGMHILMSPRQLHGIIELLSSLGYQESPGSSKSLKSGIRNRPMDQMDFQRVEFELQHQLYSGQIQSNNLTQMQDYALHGDNDDEDQFYTLSSMNEGANGMESSFSSNYTNSTTRTTTNSNTTVTHQPRGPGGSQKDNYVPPNFHEDQSTELTEYNLHVTFFSITLFHNNVSPSTSNLDKTALDLMKEISCRYFQRLGQLMISNESAIKTIRKQMVDLLSQDHLRLMGRTLLVKCNQKSTSKQISATLSVSVGAFELVETLYNMHSQDKQPELCEILTFSKDDVEDKKPAAYCSLQSENACFHMDLKSISSSKRSSCPSNAPCVEINASFSEMQTELDVTIVDRINAIINQEQIITTPSLHGMSMYHTVGPNFQSLTQTLDEGPSLHGQKISLQVSCPMAKINARFPIPDLGHVDRLWYQRNLRDDVLTLDLANIVVRTCFVTNQPLEQVQISCSEANGYLQFKLNEAAHHFVQIVGEGGSDEFNNPTVIMKFCKTTVSVFDEDMYTDDTIPPDSLNGACQFTKPEPSPFSSSRNMCDKDQDADNLEDKTQQMLLPADKDELNEFIQHAKSNTKIIVDIVLPTVCIVIPSKDFLEVLYNRLCNDMLLWEPSAPAPVTASCDHYSSMQNMNLNVFSQLLHTGEQFEMPKSGMMFDSDIETDTDTESINHYSIHDSRYPSRKKPSRQQQHSKLCMNLNIGKCQLTGFIKYKAISCALMPDFQGQFIPDGRTLLCNEMLPIGLGFDHGDTKDDEHGTVLPNKQGEVLVEVSDFNLFMVDSHNGDPNHQYLSIVINKIDLYHQACVENSKVHTIVDCCALNSPGSSRPQHKHVIYRSEPGVLVNTREDIGTGSDSLDMLSLGVKIKTGTLTSRGDLTKDEIVKNFLIAVGVRGATLRYKITSPFQSVFEQLMDFLDLQDYPILGYIGPTVVTEFHVHLWTCAIDYRPEYLPLRTLVLASSFSVSSNIIVEMSLSLLRFVLEDGALFISKETKNKKVDLRQDYVCVADIGRLELQLRGNIKNDLSHPKTELRVSSNLLTIRTCVDSSLALFDLLQYIASDGDLARPDESDLQTNMDVDISANTNIDERDATDGSYMSMSWEEHVNRFMSDAMQESSKNSCYASKESTPEVSDTNVKQTQVFFRTDKHFAGSPSRRCQPIIITQNVDLVSSSASSVGCLDDDDDTDSDDFCMINDDTVWPTSPNNGEPTIQVFIQNPIDIKEDYFFKPAARTDLLQAPENFPFAESRYTLKELTVIWCIYGGSDFSVIEPSSSGEEVTSDTAEDSYNVAYCKGSLNNRQYNQTVGKQSPLPSKESLLNKGGPGRDHCKYMELQLTKVKFQHESYPVTSRQAARQVLLINDIEIRDRLKSSRINKFLYQYSPEDRPKQTFANMVHIRAVHIRPNLDVSEEECSLKVSLQPIRLNIDQDTLFFLMSFFRQLHSKDESVSQSQVLKGTPSRASSRYSTQPIMKVNKENTRETSPRSQDFLIQLDELTHDLQSSIERTLNTSAQSKDSMQAARKGSASSSIETLTSESGRSNQPVFIKSFVFSPDVPIRLDFNGKFDSAHGAFGSLCGLFSLNKSEFKLKRLSHKQGLLGAEKVVSYCADQWLNDIKINQVPNILGGIGPMNAFIQLANGVKDLLWMPVEQYRKDGKIFRGLQRGATSFSMSTMMSVLELTNRAVEGVQCCAELTFDMVSPGPRRRGHLHRQPADLREGVSNAYTVLKEGLSDTANNIVEVTTKEHSSKGMMGAFGGLVRQIPPTIVHPFIIVPKAASTLIGGLKSHLKPEVKKEDEDKWKEVKI